MSATDHPIRKVIVVGSGPSGLLLALLLAKRGIPVEVLEAANKLDDRPRALIYGVAAARVLRRAGVIDEVRRRGFVIRDMSWRKIGGAPIATVKGMDKIDHPDRMTIYPLNLLAELLLELLVKIPCASIHFLHKVVGVTQTEDKATVKVEVDGEIKLFEADFVVGCDGASSAVRKALFGSNFPGYTWDQQIVTTNIHYDLGKYGFTDTAWTIDQDDWFIACRINTGDLWRVAYGEVESFTPAEASARLPDKFRKILPGHPEPGDYKIVNEGWFKMHQRIAEHMAVGRILLAGDAAHLCNPMGGLGLTGGIADVGSLIDCFYGYHEGKVGMHIFKKYDECRKDVYNTIIDPVSTINMKRMRKNSQNVLSEDEFLQYVDKGSSDPNFARDFLLREMSLHSDLTQYYD